MPDDGRAPALNTADSIRLEIGIHKPLDRTHVVTSLDNVDAHAHTHSGSVQSPNPQKVSEHSTLF